MKKLAMALLIGGCLSIFSAGAAFADEGSVKWQAAISRESQSLDPVMQKQQEVDRYVFEEHAKDLEKQGIAVTHTGAVDGYVEVGITPYNDANADYLYGIFGKDAIKVVEGQQAVTLDGAAVPATTGKSGTVKAETAAPVAAKTEASGNSLANVLYPVSGLVLMAFAAYFYRKLRVRKQA